MDNINNTNNTNNNTNDENKTTDVKAAKRKLIIITMVLYGIIVVCLLIVLVLAIVNLKKNRETSTTEEETIEIETKVVESSDAATDLKNALEENDDMERKIELLENAAYGYDEGENISDAMYFLGEIYFQGIGVEKDYGRAAGYFKDACGQGNKKAFSIYAKLLFMGDGVDIDYDESASYFQTLAGEDGEACYVLAIMENLGLGMPRSTENSKSYIEKAQNLGYTDASSYLSYVVDQGQSPLNIFDYSPQTKKITEVSYNSEYDDLAQMIEDYYNELCQSEDYQSFYDELENLKQIDTNGINNLTYFGNGGFLFLLDKTDGTSLEDYMASEYYSDSELKGIADNLKKQRDYVESKGSKFVLVMIPNKEIIYDDEMPKYIERTSTVTKQDKLVEYLRANTDLDIVYPKDTLLENKENFQLYYKTDTHANMIGSLFILSDLFEDMYGKKIDVALDKFDIHMQTYVGDLGMLAHTTPRYSSDTVYYYPETSVSEGEKIDSSIMLVGDSFSEFMNMEAAYYLKGGVDHRMITEYEFDYEKATKAGFSGSKSPDYVVWEVVERYLDRMK